MINKLENTNTPSVTNPQFCLMGPKVNVCHLAIEWELETQEWLAKAEVTFEGTRLDLNGAHAVAKDLHRQITLELRLDDFEVSVTATCPYCFQIYITTSAPYVLAWFQGQREISPIGMLIRCIHERWMNCGCFDNINAEDEPKNCCPVYGCLKSTVLGR